MSTAGKPNPKPPTHPLSLADTLRDLALLRAADCDLSSVLPSSTTPQSTPPGGVGESVERSYEFVREARAVIRLLNRQEVEKQGARLEEVRSEFEDVVRGLEGS